ncbi:MAG: hypothetical protein KGO05_04200 [Chloroflexota bacterium]|nr:hypothetical protein [Chloroflexota bacterium]
MDGDDDQTAGMRFELFAASLRADAADAVAFLEALATKLGGALPQRTQVEREGGIFNRAHHVRRIAVRLGEWEYALAAEPGGSLAASRTHAVRGITLKSEPMGLEDWLAELSAELADLAQSSQQDGAALRRLLS